MILTKAQIQEIKKAHRLAEYYENKLAGATGALCEVITRNTEVDGFVDHLAGDGFGFTPESNNDTHIIISKLIEHAKNGVDLTEEFILDNLSI